MPEQLVGTVDELGPGSVRGIGAWAVLNVSGERYAVSRRCRHLRADLANGRSTRTVASSARGTDPAMTLNRPDGRRAAGGIRESAGLDTAFIQLTKLWPLRRAEVVERDGNVYVRT